jgi:predicted nuclease with RNAse H fold
MPARIKVFFGVDLAGRVDEVTGVAALSEKSELIFVNEVKPDIAIRNYIDFHRPNLVAIDAPLSIPSGRYGTYASRKCDRDMTSIGIPAFATSMLAQLTFRALTIQKQLQPRYPTIEVYPQATKVMLGISHKDKKVKEISREIVQTRLARYVKGMPRTSKILLSDHELDAILAAYTAMLYNADRVKPIGDPQEGVIYIPVEHLRQSHQNGIVLIDKANDKVKEKV